ncbi:MAG: hypothetical protein ABJE10_22645 [bacterium]
MAAVLAVACGGASEQPTKPKVPEQPTTPNVPAIVPSRIRVTLKREGNGRDADGVTVTFDGRERSLQEGVPVVFDSVTPGTHVVRFGGIAPQCVGSADSAATSVVQGATSDVSLSIHCVGGLVFREIGLPGNTALDYLGEDGRVVPLTTAVGNYFYDDFSRDGSRILFSDRSSEGGIPTAHLFSVRVDGSDPRQLTSGAVDDVRPRWSPDGTRIVFFRLKVVAGGYQSVGLVMMSADGSNLHSITDSLSFDIDPVWSNDGSKIYFGCSRFHALGGVCVISPDGSGLRAVSLSSVSTIDDTCAGFCLGTSPQHLVMSPDGKAIVFETNVTAGRGPQGIWVAALDEADATHVTSGVTAFDARWSPGSDKVLFNIGTPAGQYAIGTVSKTGSGFRQLTRFDDGIGESADWSPDSATIAYERLTVETQTQQVMIMKPDGTGSRAISGGLLQRGFPRWNPLARPGIPSFAAWRSADVSRALPSARFRTAPVNSSLRDAETKSLPLLGASKCAVVVRGPDTRVTCTR